MPFIHIPEPLPTTAYHLPGSGPLFCLIPGNPGLIEYYTEYIDCLKKELPDYSFLVLSHIGCDSQIIPEQKFVNSGTVTGLDAQIQHKIDILKAYVESPRDVILAGHSVGAWMVQRIATRLKSECRHINIVHVMLLTPTIYDIAQSPKGMRFTSLVGYISRRPGTILARFAQFVGLVCPRSVLTMAIELGMGGNDVPQHAVKASMAMAVRPQILQQVGNMAVEEMVRIGTIEESDTKEFWELPNIWLFFAQTDDWISTETQQEIIRRFGPLSNVSTYADTENGIVHAFCVRHSKEVAWLTAEQIRSK